MNTPALHNNRKLGNAGEQSVIDYITQLGFIVCAQNYRKFFGEIDIIAYKKNLYIFIEVKTRKSDNMCMKQLISTSKQAKIIKTAQTFVAERQLGFHNTLRFDVALVLQQESGFEIEYIENAFTKPESGYYEY